MSAVEPDLRSVLETGFVGRVTAGLGHELNNVLATVDGLAGLQGDLLSLAGEEEGTLARLGSAAKDIERAVRRGKELTGLLRSLAHSADRPESPLDVERRLDEATRLCRRFAERGRVALGVRPRDGAVVLRGRAFDLLHVTCRCLFTALARAETGDEVTLGAEPAGNEARIVTACASGARRGAEFAGELGSLSRLVELLGGKVAVHGPEFSPFRLVVTLPRTMGPDTTGGNG